MPKEINSIGIVYFPDSSLSKQIIREHEVNSEILRLSPPNHEILKHKPTVWREREREVLWRVPGLQAAFRGLIFSATILLKIGCPTELIRVKLYQLLVDFCLKFFDFFNEM